MPNFADFTFRDTESFVKKIQECNVFCENYIEIITQQENGKHCQKI